MMREIKFRTFYKDENILYRDVDISSECLPIDDENVVIMQYTGLKDKNGVDIYEGDIVNAWSQGTNANLEVKWGTGIAGFFLYREKGAFVWHLSGGGLEYNLETVEVIGNIYENPELLHVKANDA